MGHHIKPPNIIIKKTVKNTVFGFIYMFLIYMAFPNFAKQKIPRILQRITSLTLGSSALLTTPQPLEAKGYMKERRHHRLQPTVFQSLSLLRLLLRNYTLESIHSHLQNLLLFQPE